jgi:hypothetical protein
MTPPPSKEVGNIGRYNFVGKKTGKCEKGLNEKNGKTMKDNGKNETKTLQ